MFPVWRDEGAWIALGVSALCVLMAWGMHRVFVNVLKSGAPDPQEKQDE